MAPRIRPKVRSQVTPKLNVTVNSSRAELKQALDQARKAVTEAQQSGSTQQKKDTQAKYIKILRMQPKVIPTGEGGVSPRILSTKERVATGNVPTYGNKTMPPGDRLDVRKKEDSGGEFISDYIKRKYPNKKYGGKISYKMTGGQVVDAGYE